MRTLERTGAAGLSSEDVLRLRGQYVPAGLSVALPLVVARAEGSELIDPDGRRYIDLASGIGAQNLGHAHPDLVAAAREQLERFTHVAAQVVTYEGYVRLAAELDRIFPVVAGGSAPFHPPAERPRTKTVLLNSGAEAVENALKIARVATGREWVIAFQNSFHGRTYTAMTATGKTKNSRFPFMRTTAPSIAHLPYPYPYRPLVGGTEEQLTDLHVRLFEKVLETNLAPEHVAAVIAEPVQGEGGFVVPPRAFFRRIKEICERHGIFFIADEVQTGFARTGRMFGIEHFGVTPDLLVTSKSLGGGFPLGAVTGRAELFDGLGKGSLGATFGGHPVACATALATIRVIERDGICERSERLGAHMQERFREMATRHASIGDVRGLGSMVAVEFVEDRRTKKPAAALYERIQAEAFERGVVLVRAGLYGNVLRVLAPLTIPEAILDQALDQIDEAIAASG
jgi:4-aminobutyrate aminotransferase/(S)-3-amino-2-methylpropionate transaminase